MHRHVTFREKNSFLVYSATLYKYIIDIKKIYTDGQSVLSSMRVEPFAVLFWALVIVLVHILQQVTQPTGLASLIRGTGTLLYGRGQLGST